MKVYKTKCCEAGEFMDDEWVSHCPKCGSYNPKLIVEDRTYFDVSEPPKFEEEE